MFTFKYTATSADGEKTKGELDATSERAARRAVAELGLEPVKVARKRSFTEIEIAPKRVKGPELMHFSRQLAAFLRAGIPILDGLGSLAEGTDNPRLREVLLDIADGLRSGETFSEALEAHPKVFPPVYRGMVRTSELTGNLDSVLDQLSTYLERDLDARREVRSALTYPSIIMLMAIVTVTILTLFVMPRFEVFFQSLDATLPLPTRMLLGATGFLGKWWYALLAGIAVVVGAGWAYVRQPSGRAMLDKLLLKLPVVGGTIQFVIVERFCRTLGSMVQAGVSLTDALAVAGAGTNNTVYVRALNTARDEMIRGDGIAQPIARTELFPGAVTQMIKAGENTGSLDEQLNTAASYYEQELRFKIKNLTGIFEPAVIVVVGVIVGFVALALVTAMYGIFSQAGGV